MKLELLEITPEEDQKAWTYFRNGSLIQRAIHNELVKRILEFREQLETAKPEDICKIQADLKAHRFLFSLIHRKDNQIPSK